MSLDLMEVRSPSVIFHPTGGEPGSGVHDGAVGEFEFAKEFCVLLREKGDDVGTGHVADRGMGWAEDRLKLMED